MTDEEHFDAALDAVYAHHAETNHPRRFLASRMRLRFTCETCAKLLYEGPRFADGIVGEDVIEAPPKRVRHH